MTGVIRRKRGIFSGTVVTNLVDGCVNLMCIGYSLHDVKDLVVKVGGDDNVMFTTDYLPRDRIVLNSKRVFGMDLSFDPEHCFKRGEPFLQFLGSKFTPEGPERDVMRMAIGATLMKSR